VRGSKANVQRTAPDAQRPTQQNSQTPLALTIAGSDSSAGAGIQADLKTFSALGVYGLTVVTCVVAETPGKVVRIEAVSAPMVREQLEIILDSFPVAAIKTGLLYSAEIISAVVDVLVARKKSHIPLVVDPVMVATGGDPLLQADAVALYEKELFPCASLITPNLDEAGRLVGRQINDRNAMNEAGRALADRYGTAVLLKGGHLSGDDALDLLFDGQDVTEFHAPFVRGVSTHGTGCTYSAAITAGLAAGLALEPAIENAKKFVTESIRNHFEWNSIHALNHFFG
jgi:hydroxymethylpyrimidine/phosphomethylpyrimidine kinase